MKRLLVLFVILSLFLSACRTAQSNSTDTSSGTESHSADTQGGTLDPTNETTAATAGSGETGTVETTQGTESTTGTTAPNAGETQGGENTQPTQGSTQPTEGSTTPTEGNKPTVAEPPATEETTQLTTNPSTPTSPTIPTTPTNPTTPTTPTEPVTPTQPAATLTINTKNKTTIFVGETLQIDYSYSGDKSELTWSTADTSKLTVDDNGVVIGKAAGSVTVRVTDGNNTARVTIKVSDAAKATSIKEWNHNAPLYDGVVKYAGDYMTFEAMAQPDNSNINVTVISSQTSVVSVSYDYDYSNITQVTLNFKSAGTATVTITSADGNVSKSYSITVESDYDFNPGGGQLTPEQFVNAYNGVVSANGMSTSGMPTGYLVLTLSDSELTWANARRNAEGRFHEWWAIGYRTLVLTYEDRNEDGNHVFYVRGY